MQVQLQIGMEEQGPKGAAYYPVYLTDNRAGVIVRRITKHIPAKDLPALTLKLLEVFAELD